MSNTNTIETVKDETIVSDELTVNNEAVNSEVPVIDIESLTIEKALTLYNECLDEKEQKQLFDELPESIQLALLDLIEKDIDESDNEKEIIVIEKDISIIDIILNSGLVNFVKSHNKIKKHIIDRNCLYVYKEIKDMSTAEKIQYLSYKKNLKALSKDISNKKLSHLIDNQHLIPKATCFNVIVPLQQFQILQINRLMDLLNNPFVNELHHLIKELSKVNVYTKLIEKEV